MLAGAFQRGCGKCKGIWLSTTCPETWIYDSKPKIASPATLTSLDHLARDQYTACSFLCPSCRFLFTFLPLLKVPLLASAFNMVSTQEDPPSPQTCCCLNKHDLLASTLAFRVLAFELPAATTMCLLRKAFLHNSQ